MKLSDIYQSRFLSAQDIPNDHLTVRITGIGVENLRKLRGTGEEPKIIADIEIETGSDTWIESKKKFVIGKNNSKILKDKIGEETDDWIGRILILIVLPTTMGDSVHIKAVN